MAMARQMDDQELKMAIANAIFSDPEHKPFNFGSIDGLRSGIISIEFQRIGNLQTQIRVKTQSNGTHYYTLKLSEML
jgi:hypothetical protein